MTDTISPIIADLISTRLGININSVQKTVALLTDGATVPFIARYRKEATGALDETQIQAIKECIESINELAKRKETIISTIQAQNRLTDDLKTQIDNCWDSTQLEDIYLPFKPKRRTRADIARQKGLEPLARLIMAQNNANIEQNALRYTGKEVATADEAIQGAKDIIAEWVSENKRVRNTVRRLFAREAHIKSTVAKGKEQEGETYATYFDVEESLKRCSSHRILAMMRGENEGVLKVDVSINPDKAIDEICRIVVQGYYQSSQLVEQAAADSYKRLIKPSIETEFRNQAKAKADDEAIEVFAQNVRQLLFAPPLGEKNVIAIDPGFRTGCKVVCLDKLGNLKHHDVIYPAAPRCDIDGATRTLTTLAKRYSAQAIAIGNGTASRETTRFVKSIDFGFPLPVYVVSESGASIYSASKVARDEFPNEDVTVRGAVSIGRRLIDPLAELVKIDPKSIGVGQYQHDVDQTKLKRSLDFVVESCVNNVGVNVNTASKELLSYVAGIGPTLAQNIVNYRSENGNFASRADIMNVPRMGAKAFEQCAGFLRIAGGNPLDNSSIHPERYAIVRQMAKDCHCSVADLFADSAKRSQINIDKYITPQLGKPTLTDILSELEKPGRDPRTDIETTTFDDNINSIDDLAEGMVLQGIVTNITQFGVFVDIGIHENGLVHISELSDRFVKSPSEIVKIGQKVAVRVKQIDLQRSRIALSMKGVKL
ncbi:MAG: Tex family protein [Muribaculaceae bacterium]